MQAGLSWDQIATRVRRGELVRMGRGVYARADVARKYAGLPLGEQMLLALSALAVAGPGAVVSHQTAARLHGIELLGKVSKQVTLTCRPGHGWRKRAGVRVHVTELPDADVSTRFGFAITTAARTVADLARELDFAGGVVAADSALQRNLTSKDELAQVIAACRGWPGITRAAAVAGFADGRAESPLESLARIVFRDGGLPPPDLQVWLSGVDPEPEYRVDFYWHQYRTIVEVDGAMKYDLDPGRARVQLERDRLLREAGYEVLHFTWDDITRNPAMVIAAIRQAFQRGQRNIAARS